MPDLKPAIWDGPFNAELPDRGLLKPGEEHLVSDKDLESSWWKPVKRAKKPAAKPSRAKKAAVNAESAPTAAGQATSDPPGAPDADGGDS